MNQRAILLPIALALTMFFSQEAGAQATQITACGTINQSGAYELANNLGFTTNSGACLEITADLVTIDLAGFSISGSGIAGPTTAIEADKTTTGIAVRNGSISAFAAGVNLGGVDSIVEGLRVFGIGLTPSPDITSIGIAANGIIRDNTALNFKGFAEAGTGIVATGTVVGNFVSGNGAGMQINQGSTVIGNLAIQNSDLGIEVVCPSNVTDNTAVNTSIGPNLIFVAGTGCNSTDNLAP